MISPERLSEAHTLAELEQLAANPIEEWAFLEPVDGVFRKYVAVKSIPEAQKLIVNGNRVPIEMIADFKEEMKQPQVRLYDALDRFIGIYTYIEETDEFKPVKLFME